MPDSDSRSFRQFMSSFATGITVMTVRRKDGSPAGLTINSFTSLSLKPPLVLFCLDREAHVYPFFKQAKHFAVNILADDQEDVSRHFANAQAAPGLKNVWMRSDEACPLLRGTLGWMVCRKVETHKGGDHDIFIGQVEKIHKRTGVKDPLLYFRGHYRRIGDA